MKILERTCEEFIAVLASKEPAPGGGGAAALCGAVGTALGNMVGSLTVGKKKYADVEDEIRQMKQQCDQLQDELMHLAEEDARAFEPLARAYGLPAQTEEEKAVKQQVLEECSRDAASVPLQIMRKCCSAIELADRFSQIGSRLAISDAGCAASILRGALEAASLNIYINTRGMQDREYADQINRQADEMLAEYAALAESVFERVRQSLK